VHAITDVFDRAQEALRPVTALVVVHLYESESSGGLLKVTPPSYASRRQPIALPLKLYALSDQI
jgi:hypothetical protein